MSKTLILFSTVHGQTRKICDRIAEVMRGLDHEVTLMPLEQAPSLEGFDKVVLGASIRHGKHNSAVYQFIEQNLDALRSRAGAFFSVSLVARKQAKNTAATNPYMQDFLAKSPWRPELLEVFGGNLHYQGYSAMDRNIIRFIMWLTKGPTDPNTKVEYTDWQKVDRFSREIASMEILSR
ncbi:menaquinone-dependent protoporphyrinogen IX dehydrogenase [Shewanella zhangzhouensis]|uniref:menaquinone-dependent protoporphyrinogen IX dehydrogenase n=1 Tax=Shewanella zhangzhouensis TaxID=2864213 RepID=UPI001C65FA8E|nr:menaquinone-dependent protoporphyrinogen IX dehydrogenase [Shewanella zhangzhouensis]QYK04518.1 menaquinone-dependent protoporphyrinogen IX dehydrogenase [Shewanella zhangzhouensis]